MLRLKTALILLVCIISLGFGPHASATDDLASLLARIEAASAKTRTISADLEWKSIQSEPVPDEEVQVGSIFFKRENGNSFKMAAKIRTVNGRPVPKILTYSNGRATLYEKLADEFHSFKAGDNESVFDSILLLGFGVSRRNLTENFDVKLIRFETLNGIHCAVLELIPKSTKTREKLASVMIWFDIARGVGMKEIFDEREGMRRECLYNNIEINTHLPPDAFRQR